MQQGPGDGQLLAHTFRKLGNRFLASIPQFQHAQIAFDLPGNVFDFVETGEEIQIALGAEAIVQSRRFGQDAHHSADLGILLAEFEACYHRASGCGGDQRCQHADRRRFPGAVRTQKAEHLTGVHLQAQSIHGNDVVKLLGQ